MSQARFARRFLVLILAVLLVSPHLSAIAQSNGQPVTNPYQALLDRFQTVDTLRIIVGLKLPEMFQPEGNLRPLAIDRQRQAIYATQQALLDNLKGYAFNINARYTYIPYLALTVDADTLKTLTASPLVISLHEDVPVPPTLASSVPVIGADNVWDAGYDGTGWAVAVLDTGVQWDHSFLGGSGASRVISEACYSNSGGLGGGVTLCPDSTYSQTVGHAADPTAANCLNGAANICTHGTHVAGIVAGHAITLSGVARNANLIGVQVFTRFNTDAACGTGLAPCVLSYSADQIYGLQRVYELRGTYNIAAVNMSLGSGKYTDAQQLLCDSDNVSIKAAIDTLRSVGIATIIATGNNGYTDGISAPGCISSAIGVGATTDADAVASFSNSSNLVDLLAPGVSIDSSVPPGTYASAQGTSMATPHVAGAWALLKSVAPTTTVDSMLAVLRLTGVPVLDTRNSITKSRIQVDAAAGVLTATTWLGNSPSWNTAANWSTNKVPSRIANVTIPTTPSGGNFPIVDANAAAYDLTIANGAQVTVTTPYTFNVSGNWNVIGTGAFNATTGTVVFRGDRPQTITMTTNTNDHFYHLQIGDGSTVQTVSPGSNLNIDGNLEIKAGATLAGGNRTFNVGGNWLQGAADFLPGTSTVRFDGGNQAVNKPITVTAVMTQDFAAYDSRADGNFTNGAPTGWSAVQYGDGTSLYNTWWFGRLSSWSLNGGLAVRWQNATATYIDAWLFSPKVTLKSEAVYKLQFAYRVGSAIDPQTLAVYYGAAQAKANMVSQVFTATVANTGWVTITQPFTVAVDGDYYLGFWNYDATANYYGTMLDNITLTEEENLTFYNVLVSNGSTLTPSGDVKVKNDLSITANGTVDLNTRNLTVDGTLTNNGTLRQQKNVSAATEFLHIQNAAGNTDKYFGLVITPTATALQTTTVAIKGNQTGGCTSNPTDALLYRCYKIMPTSQQSANIKFYYTEAERNSLSANALRLWHYDGPPGQWTLVGSPYSYSESGTTCATAGGTACWVQATAISTYSPFGAGSPVIPTAVQVAAIEAASSRPAWGLLGLVAVSLITLGGVYIHRRARRA